MSENPPIREAMFIDPRTLSKVWIKFFQGITDSIASNSSDNTDTVNIHVLSLVHGLIQELRDLIALNSTSEQLTKAAGNTGEVQFNKEGMLSGDSEFTWDYVNNLLGLDAIQFRLAAGYSVAEGQMAWNDDDGVLNIGMPGGNVVLQVGLESLVRVVNKSGSDIPNGKLVYVSGSQGNRDTIELADNTDVDTIFILGMTTEDIDNNANGYVARFGYVRGSATEPIDTSGTVEGDPLYLGTSGDWTTTHPSSSTAAVVVIGNVNRVHATEGVISLQSAKAFTVGNNFNGIIRQSVINKSTGNAAGAGFTAVNDNGYFTTIGIAGSGNVTFPNNVSIHYAPGYGDHWQAIDGNKDFVWFSDPTDSHNNSSLANEIMKLVAAGHLKLVKDNSKYMCGAGDDMSIYYDGTDAHIKTDEVAASDLNLTCGANKTLELQNVVYEDIQVSISNIRIPAANAPTERLYNHGIGGGVTFPVLGFAVNEYFYFDLQTSHSMKLNTILDNHIHFMTPTDGSATPDRFQFQLDVIAAGIGGNWAVPTGSPFTSEHIISADYTNSHELMEIADIPSVNTTVSTIYKCKLTRIAATQDEYGGEVYVEFTDSHYQKNTLGSRQEGAK